jgi:ribosomal-protein-alanine N-acetyltransferase
VTSDVALRPMRWWDLERVAPLERVLFGATAWTPEAFWSELAHPDTRTYLVAESTGRGTGGDLLGYAGVMTNGAESDVQTIAVAPSAQGRGLGGTLLEALVEHARGAGATSMLLEVRADNVAAIGLYERHGFDRIAVRRRYYQPGGVDAWVMRLRPLDPLA